MEHGASGVFFRSGWMDVRSLGAPQCYLWIQMTSVTELALLVSSQTIQVWHIFCAGRDYIHFCGRGYRVMSRDEAFHQLASAISLA
jgi:hypothetical protein